MHCGSLWGFGPLQGLSVDKEALCVCLLVCYLQVELGLSDRVAFASKYSYNACLQAINGALLSGAPPLLDSLVQP